MHATRSLCLANIELAVAKKDFEQALVLSNALLDEVTPLTSVDIPEVMRWKASALRELGHIDQAHQVLTAACSLARDSGSNLHLWLILAELAELDAKLGNQAAAGANRGEARIIVEQIADSVREVGLRDSFLNQPRMRELMR